MKPSADIPPSASQRAELRQLFRPERRWHWLFHLVVVLVAASYWVVSAYSSRDGTRSAGETILYRLEGDSQLWPLITSLSTGNFGEPTEFSRYGTGTLSAPIPAIAPYALAYAAFGPAGYAVADVVCAWSYFLALCLFLRLCGVGRVSSLLIGAAVTTGLLQMFTAALGGALTKCLGSFGVTLVEHSIPNLVELKIYGNRVQRPMVTEIWVVLTMAGLLRLWREPGRATVGFGLGLGVLMGLLAQGDFYSLAALGLVFGAVLVHVLHARGWKPLAKLVVGALLGAALVVWYFVYQRLAEHPDLPRRLGMTPYGRSSLLFISGLGPWLRVGAVAAFAVWLCALARRRAAVGSGRPAGGCWGTTEGRLAAFLLLLVLAALLAQPVQIFLLGKGAQIYHYRHNLVIFYSYAMLVLGFLLARFAVTPRIGALLQRLAAKPGRAGAIFLALLLGGMALAGMEPYIERVYFNGTVRGASVEYEPWGGFGDEYRAGLSQLDRGLQQSPGYTNYQTFATLNLDIYVLLAAFHGKRAFLPDASTTVLTDMEIEDRLCILGKICNLRPEKFAVLIQSENIKNYFWGSNKYRFASDHRFASDTNQYNASLFEDIGDSPYNLQWGWILAVPRSEIERVVRRYIELGPRQPNFAAYPDLLIFDHNEVAAGWEPLPHGYALLGTNTVFRVYGKITPTLTR